MLSHRLLVLPADPPLCRAVAAQPGAWPWRDARGDTPHMQLHLSHVTAVLDPSTRVTRWHPSGSHSQLASTEQAHSLCCTVCFAHNRQTIKKVGSVFPLASSPHPAEAVWAVSALGTASPSPKHNCWTASAARAITALNTRTLSLVISSGKLF